MSWTVTVTVDDNSKVQAGGGPVTQAGLFTNVPGYKFPFAVFAVVVPDPSENW